MIDDGRPLYHLTLFSELHGQEVQNGYWFVPRSAHTNPDNVLDCNAIIDRFNARVMPYIKQFSSDDLHFIGLLCSTIRPHFGAIVERGFDTSEGDQPDESLHSTASGVLSLRTGLGGGRHRGRTYYGGVSKADCESSRLTPGALTRLQALGDQLLSSFGIAVADNEYIYGVFSKKAGLIPNAPPLEGSHYDLAGFTPITQTIARTVIGTQRHRQPRKA